MSDWIHRHLQLTREERLLLAAIVIILLCGIAAWRYRSPETPDGNQVPPAMENAGSGRPAG